MEDNKAPKQFPWATAVVAVAIVIVTALALIAYLKTGRGVKDTIDKGISLTEKVIDKAPEIARNFKTGKITHTFRGRTWVAAKCSGEMPTDR